MADVGPGRTGRERGQLILVTGLLVAVSFVVLTLLFNTAIFTDNLASRGTDIGGYDAVEFHRTTVDGLGELVDKENRREHASQLAVEANVTIGIVAFDDVRVRQGVKSGAISDLNESAVILHEGALVRHTNGTAFFEDAAGLSDWTMATSIPDTRQFAMTVDRTNLNSTDAANATSAFHVLLSDNATTTEWRVFVYENSGEIAVAVKNDTAAIDEVCSVNQAQATINLTAGTLAGEPCAGLVWANGIGGDYDVAYRNGDRATGTYNLTLNTSASLALVNGLSVNDGTTTTASPYHVPAVYSAALPLHYETPGVEYRTTVRVARGEPS